MHYLCSDYKQTAKRMTKKFYWTKSLASIRRLLPATLLLWTASALAANPAATEVGVIGTNTKQMEHLDRGLVAVTTAQNTVFVSWRFLGTDDEDHTTFELLKNGNIADVNFINLYKTNVSTSGSATDKFQVVTKVDGLAVDTSKAVTPSANIYLSVPLSKPASTSTYAYTPNDCSVGDVDGDGEYEIILKWDPNNSKDNSQSGITGNVYLDCYKLNGTQLWRIDLGKNIRAGAHYTQFLVYDFDGDGKAEIICKTAPGSIDGAGNYVTAAATDATIKAASNTAVYRTSSGYIMSGPEYLTVFNGLTGSAVHTIWYNPNRAGTFNQVGAYPSKDFWGDDYANRSERYLATVAYLDGADKNPSAVMCRGYYTRAYLWAVDFDGKQLSTKWLHASTSQTLAYVYDPNFTGKVTVYSKNTSGKGNSYTAYGNGNHNLSCADVDGDGCDEIVWGSSAIDNDGKLLYSTGFGHGDAIHMSKLCPDRDGLQVFEVHEESGAGYGWDVHDAATGEVLLSATGTADNGRGMAAQLLGTTRGFLFSSSNDRQQRSAVTGDVVSAKNMSVNFRLYWDGTLQDCLLDGNTIDKLTSATASSRVTTLYNLGPSATCNSTKKTPNLSADILGDWREEVILWDSSDSAHLAIYPSTIATEYRMPTLMHDHTYRMGITWQNAAYNQPPHLGYYLPDAMKPRFLNIDTVITVNVGDSVKYQTVMHYVKSMLILSSTAPDGTVKKYVMPDGFTKATDYATHITTIKGEAAQAGDYIVQLKLTGMGGEVDTTTIVVHAIDLTGIKTINTDASSAAADKAPVYNLQGMKIQSPDNKSIYIRNGKKFMKD